MTNTTIPQLRLRTEFTFRKCFGPVARVASAVQALGSPAAAIVDEGTWGHVRWAKAAAKHGFKPIFGTELTFPQPDERKPKAWFLASETRGFYRFTTAVQQPEADLMALVAGAQGVLRFAGAALTDPATFDYIDLNPGSRIQQLNALRLHQRTGKPLVVTSDNAYPRREDFGAFLALGGREAVTPQHILSDAELRAALSILSDDQWAAAVRNTHEVAERCAHELPKAPIIQVPGDLRALAAAGKEERLRLGHIAAWTDEYEARLQRELDMIAQKQFESYFIVVSDLVRWAKTKMLVGPARGSSAGSLVCFLLRITEVDPLVHDLLFERFIDVTRKDLPDIDIDFADTKRDMVFTYLSEKYGRENVARIGNVNTLQAKSAIHEVSKRMAVADRDKFDLINSLVSYSSGDSRYGHALEDTITQTEAGKKFIIKYPKMGVLYEVEGHAWHTGVHAAGVIVCNVPVSDYCTISADGVAQIDKPDSEALNLLKIDALGLRTLGVIEDSGVVDADTLYGLKLDDPEVFSIFNQQRYSGVFQFEGQAQRRVAAQVDVRSFKQLDHVTALARPGPLGGGASNRYILRAAGHEPVEYRHPTMANYLGKTMGVVLYQEQVMRICFEIGSFSWEVVSEIRKAMSGRKGTEYFNRRGEEFVAGAAKLGIPADEAQTIWGEICTFGAWGMNASHTVSYAIISYWCAWMKRYHPLEYAAAALRNAKDDEQTVEILRELVAEGGQYIPFDIERSGVNWGVADGKLVGGFMNLVGYGPAKASAAVEARNAGTMTPAMREKILAAQIKFTELHPLHAAYGAYFSDPEAQGIRPGSHVTELADMPDKGDVLALVRVVRKEQRDENETIRAARRGKRLAGPTLFLDIFVTDDSGVPYTLRIDRFSYVPLGERCAEHLREGDDLLVRGRKIPGFNMIKVEKLKPLNREIPL